MTPQGPLNGNKPFAVRLYQLSFPQYSWFNQVPLLYFGQQQTLQNPMDTSNCIENSALTYSKNIQNWMKRFKQVHQMQKQHNSSHSSILSTTGSTGQLGSSSSLDNSQPVEINNFVDNSTTGEDLVQVELLRGMWWKHLGAGAVAGSVSRTCTAPIDRLKVLLQVRGNELGGLGNCFRHMLAEGGWRSMWRGNGVNVLKIAPETALKFMAYEQVKRILKGNSDRELAIYERFFSGAIAGALSQSAIYPMEVLKTRLCLRTTGQYNGIRDAARKIYAKEGLYAFYRGYVPNLIGIIPYAGIDLATYETLKRYYLKSSYQNEEPGVLVLLTCGTISCTCGQIFSYPFALVRTRLQAKVDASNTMVNMFSSIYQREGFFGLYRGFLPNFLKVVPAIGISYVVYENVRNMLGAEMC